MECMPLTMDNLVGTERVQLYHRIKILGKSKLIHVGSAVFPLGYNEWNVRAPGKPDIVFKRVKCPMIDDMDGKQEDMFVADIPTVIAL